MTIQERKYHEGGMGGGGWLTRVVSLPDGEPIPEGATVVPDDTPLHDFLPEKIGA